MTLATARKNLEPIMRDSKKIYPKITNDWILTVNDNFSGGSRVIIKSEILNESIDTSESGLFLLKYILNGELTLDNNKIVGSYAYTKNGFIKEEEYMLSEDMVEESKNVVAIKPSELQEGIIYNSDSNELYLYVGELKDSVIIYEEKSFKKIDNSLKQKTKNKYLIKINIKEGEVLFVKFVKKTTKLKLISEDSSVSRDVLNEGKRFVIGSSRYSVMGMITNNISIKVKEKDNIKIFIEYKGEYYVEEKYYNYREDKGDIEILSGKVSDYGMFTYKKIKNINVVNDFLNSEDTELNDFLSNEDYFIDYSDKDKRFFYV